MKLAIGQEPDVVYGEQLDPTKIQSVSYSPFRTYDIEIWADDTEKLFVTAYAVLLDKDDPETIAGTDHDTFTTISYNLVSGVYEKEIEWWLCDFLALDDWNEMVDLSEWTTYWGNNDEFQRECSGKSRPMPDSIREWLNSLPEYEPRKEDY